MRFLMMYHPTVHAPPTPQQMIDLGKFSEVMTKSGTLLESGGILPSSKGARVLRAEGDFTVVDGPFPETKELIVGYAIVRVASKAEAIEVAKQFMNVAGDGEGEIFQMTDGSSP